MWWLWYRHQYFLELKMEDIKLDSFMLSESELCAAKQKKGKTNQIIFAAMLKYFQAHKKFPPKNDSEFLKIIKAVESQLCYTIGDFNWSNSSIKRFKDEIRKISQ